MKLSSQLKKLSQKKFTGSLLISNCDRLSWKLYFRLGNLIWIGGNGSYCEEKWLRLIKSKIANLNHTQTESISRSNQDIYYYYLVRSIQEVKGKQKEDLNQSIVNIFVEIFFDIIQYENGNSEKLTYTISDTDRLPHIIAFVKTDLVEQQALLEWNKWLKAGFSLYSPNSFPFIPDLSKLQNNLNPKLISSIDGQTSLRDLAIKTNLNVINLTRILFPFISNQTIILNRLPLGSNQKLNSIQLETPDNISISNSPVRSTHQNNDSSLIMCVDDSYLMIQDLEKIITRLGSKFLGIQDPLKAVPSIIKNKPDLIFLDLIMPIVGGYELCSQIRKIPHFKDTPIIILTGKDGIVDKFKAKLVGATDFLSKSASPVKIHSLICQYLGHAKCCNLSPSSERKKIESKV